jgi:hypothetical protein
MPFQRDDYVLRQVEAIAAMIARMMGLRLEGEVEKARAELEEAYTQLLGPQAGLIRRVDVPTAMRLVGSSERLSVYAQLLEEEAAQETDGSRGASLRARAAEVRDRLVQKEPK